MEPDQSTRASSMGAGADLQRLILKSSNLLAVCGVGVDESCTVKVRS
jgi:hypothetical protein